jgi:F-type H+-transporting ATPase subunit gamma
MASTRQLKSRIRSVKSNKQITKAMELVAASKLRRAQDASRASQAYAQAARELLTQLSNLTDVKRTNFYHERPVKTRLVLLITSDRGLAGAFNSNAIKKFIAILEQDRKDSVATKVVCIGRKGAKFAARIKDVDVIGVYTGLPEHLTAADIRPILVNAVDHFIDGAVDAVDVVTTRFVNSFTQVAESFKLLPAVFETTEVSTDIAQATFEPSVEEVLEGATVRLLEAQFYQALLDARASEQSMRRVAMKNATENKVRQAAITQELSEISAGVEAMA